MEGRQVNRNVNEWRAVYVSEPEERLGDWKEIGNIVGQTGKPGRQTDV